MDRYEADVKNTKVVMIGVVLTILIIFGTIAGYYTYKLYANHDRPQYIYNITLQVDNTQLTPEPTNTAG